ncbi:MAG: hypothetical protein U0103_29305 [Candidatus Obscuribacterales bacterium]
MFSRQPHSCTVLIAILLWLAGSWNALFRVFQERLPVSVILSITPLSKEGRYFYFIDLASHCLYTSREYKSAALYADLALRHRVIVDSFNTEESFASLLMDLGKYEQAKRLLLTLAPLKRGSPEYCLAPMVAGRQELLGRCYFGLHQYRAAAAVFAKEVPELIPENTMRGGLESGAFMSSVCVGDNRSAEKLLKHWRENRHFYDPRPFSAEMDNPLFGFFISSMYLAPSDGTTAKDLCDRYIRFWQISENSEDYDAIPLLEAAAKIMEDRGFSQESIRLSSCADQKRLMRSQHVR